MAKSVKQILERCMGKAKCSRRHIHDYMKWEKEGFEENEREKRKESSHERNK
jgi:hypothetical protein